MDKDDRLMEELLKEHARKGSGADEDFLKEVEERIDAAGKVVVMEKKESPGSRWALGAGIAACLALGVGGIYFWQQNQTAGDIIAYDGTAQEQIAAQSAPPVDLNAKRSAPKEEDLEGKSVRELNYRAEGNYNLGKYDDAERMYKEVLRKDRHNTAARRGLERITKEKSDYYRRSYDQTRSEMLGQVDQVWEIAAPNAPASSIDIGDTDGFAPGWGNDSAGSGGEPEQGLSLERMRNDHNKKLAKAEPGASVSVPYSFAYKDKEGREAPASDPFAAPADEIAKRDHIQPHPVPAKPRAEQNREQYGPLVENKFVAPIDERSALSTFAVDVDTASYANVRRMINEGVQIPKDSVRVEEMVNYFDYQYAQPTGGHPFAVQVDSAACPWNEKHRIVRIGVQGKDIIREERPPANLVFLLDVSGSMNSPNKLPLLKQSMNFLLEELNEKDSVSIVVYAGASGLALPATKMDDAGRQQVADAMEKLSAGGSTAGGEGIKLAYKIAKEQFRKGGINRIILATDGDFNVGVSGTDSLTKMVKEKAREGTYLSVLGFGSGNINDNMLESITNNGNGNYNYIDTIREGRKVLLEDMMGTMVTIAKDVKVQVVMNPNKVKAYRLIGYANRMLPPEAFLDKKVDAGEIGAGHTVTALYEIIPADGKPFGPEIDGSRYFEKPEQKPNPALKDSDEMMFVKLAYKQPDQKMDDESTYVSVPFTDKGEGIKQASADLKFASAVGLFGMVLRDSEHKGSGDLNTVLELATAGKGPDGKGQREEFIQLVNKLKNKE